MKKGKISTILLIVFVIAIFGAIAAGAIIISRGGLFTDNGIVFESGVIRLKTDPSDIEASFYLDDKKVILDDQRINGLNEGTYNIRIEHPDYAIWEKNIKVESGVVTEVFAKLYPANFSIEQISNTNIDRAFFSSNGEYVYYTVTDSEFGTDKGIWKLRLTRNQFFIPGSQTRPEKIANIVNPIKVAVESGSYELIPSLDNNRLLFKSLSDNKYYVFETNSFNDSFLDLNSELGYTPAAVSWFNGSNSLIVQEQTLLFEYNLTNKISTVIRYSPSGGIVYGVGNSNVFIYDKEQKSIFSYQNQALSKLKLENITLPDKIRAIHTPLNNKRYLIIRAEGTHYYIDSEKSFIKKIATEFEFLEFAQDGKAALFINDENEIFSFSVREILAKNTIETIFQSTGFKLAADTDSIAFVPQSTHIVHYANSEQNLITVAEKDGANKVVILNNPGIKNSDFSVDSDGNKFVILLFDELDKDNPKSQINANLYSINLKEPKTTPTN